MKPAARKSGLINASSILIIALFSLDLYNPSLPSMMHNLHVSYSAIRAIAVTFLLGMALSQPFFGSFSDQFGRKPVALAALMLLLAANLATTMAENITQLFMLRFVAGLGAGGCLVIARAILCDISPNKKLLTQALTTVTIGAQISPAFAPVIGGYVEQYFTWRDNFLLLTIMTLLVLLVFAAIFRESHHNLTKMHFHILKKSYCQLLIKSPQFVCYSLLSGINYSLFIGYCTISPLLYQQALLLSPAENGLTYIIVFIAVFFGSLTLRRVIHDTSSYLSLLWLTNILYLLLFALMWLLGKHYFSLPVLLMFGFLIPFLGGFSAPVMASIALQQLKKENSGIGSSSYGMIKMLTTGIFTALFLHIHVSNLMQLAYLFLMISGAMVLITIVASCISTRVPSE